MAFLYSTLFRSRVKNDTTTLERLPLLDGVLGIEISENENTRHLQGAHRGDATMRLLGDLLGVVGPRPLVLVLEDSQWLNFGVLAACGVGPGQPIINAYSVVCTIRGSARRASQSTAARGSRENDCIRN